MEKTVYRDPNRAPRPKKRRPHWGRIVGAALVLVVLVAAVALLPKLLRKGPRPDAQADPATNSAANGTDAQGTTGEENGFVAPVAEHGDIITLGTDINPRVNSTTADGYYYISGEKRLPEGSNIKYIDYATQTETFLCSNPNCTHDTETCTSYTVGSGYVFVGYQHLYTVGWGNGVQVRDLDGSNCRTLVTLGDGETLQPFSYAADRDRFYYIRTKFDATENISTSVLECANADTGEIQPVYTMRDSDFFIGTCGPYILLRDLSQGTLRTFAVDLQGQEAQGLHFPEPFTTDQAWQYVTDKGIIYHFTFEPCTITEWNIYTGETRVLAENFPVSNYASTWIGAPINGYMPISSRIYPNQDDLDTFTEHAYILDLSTGAYTEDTLRRDVGDGVTTPIFFLAETDGRYLVYPYDRIESFYSTGEKLSEMVDMPYPVYAFITKEDFLANQPNYIEITQVG